MTPGHPTVNQAGHAGIALEIEQRREAVAVMMLARITYREMARQLNVAKSTIHRDVEAVREAWVARSTQHYGQWVGEEVALLDEIQGPLVLMASTKTNPLADRIAAVKELRWITERRSRLLGLDRPQRFEVAAVAAFVSIDDELAALVAQLDPGTTIDVPSTEHVEQ